MTFPLNGRWPVRTRFRGAAVSVAHRLALVALVLASLVAGSAPGRADGRNAVLVVDANTGNTLYASHAEEQRYPASLTKMMTLYMVFELIERGRLSYQTPIRISANAAGAAPSKLDLKEGEEIPLIDAIRVLITKSANDVAIAVAEHVGGTEANFARLMTHKAHQIGMKATTFRNASGLPDPQQTTTARDMATLALRLQDEFPQHYVLFGTRTFTYKGETFRNHNTLLFHYEGTDGIKTGYTRASGFNLVSSVKRGNKHVIGVIFGGASAATRNNAMRTYLNMGLVKASPVRTRKPAPMLMARKATTDRVASVPTPRPVTRAPEARMPEPEERAPHKAADVQPRSPAAAPAPAPLPPVKNELTMVRVKPLPMPVTAHRTRAEAPDARHAAPLPQPPRTLVKPASAVMPGSPPSSLEAQAQRLAQGTPPLAQPLPRREPTATHALHGRFHVQIGAYPSMQEAERQLAAVKSRSARLAQAKALTQPVQQGDKTLYRARYAGLESSTATQACDDLKKQGLACVVYKAE